MSKELDPRYITVCEDLGWSANICSDEDVELRIVSPAGEDFLISVCFNDFVENVRKMADDFNVDEHVKLNIGQPGAPTIKELCEDAEEIQKMLSELSGALERADCPTWYPVTVSSRKHGGGLRVTSGQIVRAKQRPEDKNCETKKMQFKTRYFSSWEEAQRVMKVIRGLKITVERVRMSVTQGEVKVFINGIYMLSFGDKIDLLKKGSDPADFYGSNIGGWMSSHPDSSFVLGLIWHPLDYAYHYSDMVCKKLGIGREDWIEGETRK